MTAPHVDRVGVAVRLIAEPVLVAPRGEHFHRAQKLNPGYYLEAPVCRTEADRWVALDLDFAELLDRRPCGRCWTGSPLQLTITDTEE